MGHQSLVLRPIASGVPPRGIRRVSLTAEQLQQVRAERWRHIANPLLTADDAREWLNAAGLVLFLPRRQQFLAPAPTFVEACAGMISETPSREAIDNAASLMHRLVAAGEIIPLNLFGTPSETPDFLATREAFPYLFSLRGTRDWKTAPGGKASPLVLEIWKQLDKENALTAGELQSALGRELTEAAVLRGLMELWSNLRVIPEFEGSKSSRWSLTQAKFKDSLTAAGKVSQTAALSALVSLYLESVLAASTEEIETFLSPLTSRSKVRETVNGLVATRQISLVPVGTQSMFHIAGALPEFAEPEPVETPAAETTEGTDAPRQADRAPRTFARKPFEKKPFERKTGERKPFERKTGERKTGERKTFGRKAAGDGPARSPRSSDGERKPYVRKTSEGKPFERTSGERKPYERKAGGGRPAFGKKPFDRTARPFRPAARPADGEGAAGGERPSFRPRTGGAGGKFPPKRAGFSKGPGFKSSGFKRAGSEDRGDRQARPFSRPAAGAEGSGGERPFRSRSEGSGDRPSFRPRRDDGEKRPGSFAGKRTFGAGGAERPRRFEGGAAGKPAFDRPRSERPSFGKPRFDKPGFDKPRSDGAGADRPRSDRSGSERPRSDRPAFDRSRSAKPSFGKAPYGKAKPGGFKPAGRDFGGKPSFGGKPPFGKSKFAGKGKAADGEKRPFFRKRPEGAGEGRPASSGRPAFKSRTSGERSGGTGAPRTGAWKPRPAGGAGKSFGDKKFSGPPKKFGGAKKFGSGAGKSFGAAKKFGGAGKSFGGPKKSGSFGDYKPRKPGGKPGAKAGGARPPFRKRKEEGGSKAE
jgi:23S rRNA pseudouridine2605 synthase